MERQKREQQTQQFQDTSKKVSSLDTTGLGETTKDTLKEETKGPADSLQYGVFFSKFVKGADKTIIIETDKYYAEFSTKGGALIKYEVKGFKTWDGYPLQLIKQGGGELNLLFTAKDGKTIDTKNLYFSSTYNPWERVRLSGDDQYKVVYELPVDDSVNSKIRKTLTLSNSSYTFGLTVELVNSSYYMSNFEYQLVWENSLKLTEYRSDLEGSHAEAFSLMGGELEVLDAAHKDENYKSDLSGNTDWVASRIKYFCIAMIAQNPKASGSFLTGNYTSLPDEGFEKNYSIALKEIVKNDRLEKNEFKIYLGPVDYSILKDMNIGLEKIMRFSLDFIVRPIAQYVILPFFLFIHNFISNWGIVIIVFSIVMKVVLTPFTRYQMKSMKKMSELQPKMNAIREKYKDEPQKQQQMVMRMYKEEKINPASGCLPMLLQLPILYALFGVFNSTIELRQAYFGLWIRDLSVPDVIFKLPFKIPLFGISDISGLALLMGITMFIQQKMTIKDPKQKAMVYLMPIMLTLLFTTLPAGLNLYYFMFNLLSIAEQIYTTKIKKTPPMPEEKPQKKR
jgi:YidC/Oxa1 family membrane protein insertase